jgi:hypothetical protein
VEVKKDKFVEYDWDEHDLRWRNRREVQFFPPPVDMGMAPDESHWILYDFNHDTQVWENRREIPVE